MTDAGARCSSTAAADGNGPGNYELVASRLLNPVRTTWHEATPIRASIECVDMGQIAVMRLKGSAHRVHHGHDEIRRSFDRVFHLAVNRTSDWTLKANGATQRVHAGDAVLIDSMSPYEMQVPDYDIINVRLSELWISRRLPSPQRLAGKALGQASAAGAALAALLAALDPSRIGNWPLTQSIVADQIGVQLCIADHLLHSP